MAAFFEPTKAKGCVDIVGAQGGCCDSAIHGSCLVFRNEHDYCYCEGTCFLDEFCCSDIQETGCVAGLLVSDSICACILSQLVLALIQYNSKFYSKIKYETMGVPMVLHTCAYGITHPSLVPGYEAKHTRVSGMS